MAPRGETNLISPTGRNTDMKKGKSPQLNQRPAEDAGALSTPRPGSDRKQQAPQNEPSQGRQGRQPIVDSPVKDQSIVDSPVKDQPIVLSRKPDAVLFPQKPIVENQAKRQSNPPQEQTQKTTPRWKSRTPKVKEPKYKLPESYEIQLKVKEDLGVGAFGETALIEVISESDDITKFFKFKKGDIVASKRMHIPPGEEGLRQFDRYFLEWMVMHSLRGHENILRTFGTQDPGPGDWFGHIFMEFCNMGDVGKMMVGYEIDYSTMLSKLGVDSDTGEIPSELARYNFLPEGFVYEFVTSVAKGLAWMHFGIKNWPKDCTVPDIWSAIMHNDMKPDNVLLTARPPGDKCPYPIFKIADFGAASIEENIAPIFNGLAAPERRARAGLTPATPKDDIFTLGLTVYTFAHKYAVYESRTTRIHQFFRSKGTQGTASRPDKCENSHPKHLRMIHPDGGQFPSRCQVFKCQIVENRNHEHQLPYSKWFGDLIEDCIELERLHRPDAVDVLESMTIMRKAYGEGSGGSPRTLWNPVWLPDYEEKFKEIEAERQRAPSFKKVPGKKSPPK
ncbi:hypothetical protein AA313_de0210307 [Arthrobotrys entomopaga]|nr:hypothetical protein AA313_de0210307 [Arthrobotrys entomopaga]